jgi:hypothetical protein
MIARYEGRRADAQADRTTPYLFRSFPEFRFD